MIRFIIAIILALVGIGVAIVAKKTADAEKEEDRVPLWPAFFALILAALFGTWSVVRVVEANEVGVPSTWGRVGDPMQSGLHVTAPWTKVTEFSTRMQELTLLLPEKDADGKPTSADNSIKVIAKDGGVMHVGVTVRWAVEKDAIDTNLYRQAGTLDLVQTRFVKPDTQEMVRNVFGQHSAEGGYSTERAQIASEIKEALAELGAPRGIIIDSVNVREVEPEDRVLAKINDIIQQRNATLLAEETQKTTLIEAETLRQKAEVDAKASVVSAQGDADAQRIAAQAEADANAKIAASLTPELINLQALQACAEALKQTSAAVVSCGGATSGGAGTSSAVPPTVIVDGR